tara:strand:+ start:3333 stop:3524 length:192 start_codon:yes stop_codon:yes gene_type:complete
MLRVEVKCEVRRICNGGRKKKKKEKDILFTKIHLFPPQTRIHNFLYFSVRCGEQVENLVIYWG